jgi:hypothetical protein
MDGEYIPRQDLTDDTGALLVDRKHSILDQLTGHDILSSDEAQSLFKFCAVRNPFDSLVSLYAKMVGSYVPLLEQPGSFIHNHPTMLQDMRFLASHSFSEWIISRYGALIREPQHLYGGFIKGMNVIMRFESLQQDFDCVADRLNLPSRHVIPVLNATEGRERDYRSYYTAASRRVVEAAFSPDLERFEYTF